MKNLKICLIGSNIDNSKSPIIHKYIGENFSLNYSYKLEKCNLIDFQFLKENYDGFNVTMPYKNEIGKYLDFAGYKSINTVKFENNKSYGISTDGEGFCQSFRENFNSDFENKNVVILGYSGSGQSIYDSILKENPKSCRFLSRKIGENLYSYSEQKDILKECDVIINTTPCTYSLIDEKYINSNMYLCDINYKEESALLQIGHKKGAKVMNGLGMLFYQGLKSCEFWFDCELKLEKSWKEIEKELTK